ncbi:MAG TPA: hypothetical protein VJ672_14300 [Gemmatimonadaceae bacterium]|nr:hypothetical protein [Gemmatimonadaceae bacterium]
MNISTRHGVALRALTVAAALTLLGACKDGFIPDQNNPGQDDFSVITSRSQLQAVASGLLAGDRFFWADRWILFSETIARNVIRFDPAEPRFITRLIRGETAAGGPGSAMSTSDFIGGANWGTLYANVRSADLMIAAVDASENATPTPLTAAEKSAAKGFAKTMKAMALLRVVESRDVLGAVVDPADPSQPLPDIKCKTAALAAVISVLNDAAADLAAGGTDFPFVMPASFGPAQTVAGFLQFNKALLAKAETYRAFINYTPANPTIDQAALARAEAAINASFYSLTAPTTLGVYHSFSTASGDTPNPLNDNSVYRINPLVAAAADPNDARRSKWVIGVNRTGGTASTTPATNTAIASNLVQNVHLSPSQPIAIIRNAELILLRAIIEWGQNDDVAALINLNRVRTVEGGLAPIAVSHAALPAAILHEVRLSLLFESSASWVYTRMLGLLNTLNPTPATHPNPLTAFPIPQGERDARSNEFACTP